MSQRNDTVMINVSSVEKRLTKLHLRARRKKTHKYRFRAWNNALPTPFQPRDEEKI
jgi:hypothetical protein